MHKKALDWLRPTNISADSALAEKRWSAAEKVADDLSPDQIVSLLRLFLFPATGAAAEQEFVDKLKAIDPDFPGDSPEELRVMSAFVMLSTFEESSVDADAFSLGIRAANFPAGRVQ